MPKQNPLTRWGRRLRSLLRRRLRRLRQRVHVARHPFRFSIVMAVYNVEPYLEEAVESVLAQDLGFREHVQLILVDDGSTDGSEALCRRYARRYPKNIVALHQENQGAASARNAGLAAAKGAYVNFMDPDDRLSPDTLRLVDRFFDEHPGETDVVAIPMYLFGDKSGSYWHNYKFNRGTRVIDLQKEPRVSAMSAASSFFRRESVQNLRFAPLPQGEDILFVTQVLLERRRLGVVAEAVYWYRRRSTSSSSTASTQLRWYTECVSALSGGLLDLGLQRFGSVPEFVSNTVMMDLRWRFKPRPEPPGGLTAPQREAYRQAVAAVLDQIDLPTVLAQRGLPFPELVQILTLKYRRTPALVSEGADLHLEAEGQRVFSLSRLPIHIERTLLDAEALELAGSFQLPAALAPRDLQQFFLVSGQRFPCALLLRRSVSNSFGPLFREYGFRCRLPLDPGQEPQPLQLVSVLDRQQVVHRSYRYERCSAFFGGVKGQYLWRPGAVLLAEKAGLRLEPTEKPRADWERAYLRALEEQVVTPERQKRPVILPKELTPERFDQVNALRAAALTQRQEKPLWLLCDGVDRAGGPAERLFCALLRRSDCPAELCFVLSADSPDFARLSELGTVLPFGSREHLTALLQADVVCFSQEREELLSPFTGTPEGAAQRRYYADLLCRQRCVLLCGSEEEAQESPALALAQKYLGRAVVLGSEADVMGVLDALRRGAEPV